MKVNCVKHAIEGAPDNADAKMTNQPLNEHDEFTAFEGAKAAVKTGRAASGDLLNGLFRWVRDPLHALNSPEAKPAGFAVVKAQTDFQQDFGNWKQQYQRLLATIDDIGGLPKVPGIKFDKQTAARFKAYLTGALRPEDLHPGEVELGFRSFKNDLVSRMNLTSQYTRELVPPGISPRRYKAEFLETDDVLTPTIAKVFDSKNPNATGTGLVTVVSKETYTNILAGKDPELVTAGQWVGAAMPQIIKKHHFDQAVDVLRETLKILHKTPNRRSEQAYVEMLINRIAGKKTKVQAVLDDITNKVRQDFGYPDFEFSPSGAFASMLTRNYYRGALWLRGAFPIVNLTQSFNKIAQEGLAESFAGAVNLGKEMTLLRRGQRLVDEAQLFGDLEKFWLPREPQTAFTKTGGKIGEMLAKADNVGYVLVNGSEYLNRGLAFHIEVSKQMRAAGIKSMSEFLALRGGTQHELWQGIVRKGIEASAETQFLYGIAHQSPLFTTPLAKLLVGQFMSFPIHQSEFLWKAVKEQPLAFPLRYLALTGFASAGMYYGFNIALGNQIGGAGAVPDAIQLFREGHSKEAISTAGWGVFKYLPSAFTLARGSTPFVTFMNDVLGVFAGAEQGKPQEAMSRVARSGMLAIPGGLAIRQASEAALAQMADGNRFQPQGFVESTGLIPAIEAGWEKMLGKDTSFALSGPLANKEGLAESVRRGLGLQTVQQSLERQQTALRREATDSVNSAKRSAAESLAAAMKAKDTTAFNQLLNQAITSGVFKTPDEMTDALGAVLTRRTESKEKRIYDTMPKSLKLEELRAGKLPPK